VQRLPIEDYIGSRRGDGRRRIESITGMKTAWVAKEYGKWWL